MTRHPDRDPNRDRSHDLPDSDQTAPPVPAAADPEARDLYEPDEHPGGEDAEARDRELRLAGRRDMARERWRRTVPPVFEHAPHSTMNGDQTLVRDWTYRLIHDALRSPALALGRAGSIMFVGATGRGKTHAAWWVIGHMARSGVLVGWEVVNLPQLYKDLEPSSPVDGAELMSRCMRAPLLVLDDLGRVEGSAHTRNIDYRILNYRSEHILPTIITTNMTPRRTPGMPAHVPVLEDRLDDMTMSRLTGMVGGNVVPFLGHDRRRQRAPRGDQ